MQSEKKEPACLCGNASRQMESTWEPVLMDSSLEVAADTMKQPTKLLILGCQLHRHRLLLYHPSHQQCPLHFHHHSPLRSPHQGLHRRHSSLPAVTFQVVLLPTVIINHLLSHRIPSQPWLGQTLVPRMLALVLLFGLQIDQ